MNITHILALPATRIWKHNTITIYEYIDYPTIL